MSGPLSLQALLSHPENGGLRYISGPSETSWTEVAVESDEIEATEGAQRRLVILSGSAPNSPWQRDALLRRLVESGVTGLALRGIGDDDDGICRLAERIGLTLLGVERPLDLARACWHLGEARDTLALWYVQRIARAFEHRARDLADLIARLAKTLGHPVAIVDSGKIIHESGGSVEPSLHHAVDLEAWIYTVRGERQVGASVRIDGTSRPGLRLVIADEGLDDSQIRALRVAAEVAMPAVAARILIDEVAAVSDLARSSALLRDFMDQRDRLDADIERRMAERSWRTNGYHLAFRMIGRSRLEPFELLRFVIGVFSTLDVSVSATTIGRGMSGWITTAEPLTADAIERLMGFIRSAHVIVRREFNVATGVGTMRSGATGLQSTLDEASDAARLALNRSGSSWFMRVDGLGLERLLLSGLGSDLFVPAATALLAPLREAGGDLVETLSVYLDNESRLANTAAALGVHRNTVTSRIDRALGLLGVDLEDPESRLAVHLACRAARSTHDSGQP